HPTGDSDSAEVFILSVTQTHQTGNQLSEPHIYCWLERSGLIAASLHMELWLRQIRHVRFDPCSLETSEPG
ncbi:Hypothetical predicted protein, partial [Scomber scombrus]